MNTIDVAAGLVFHAGQLLITQRCNGDHLEGLWEFPGGKREPNESFEACLIRELQEELNIQIAIEEPIADVTHAYPQHTVHLRFFRCRWMGGIPQPIGCQALAWINAVDLKNYTFPPADAQLIASLVRHPTWWQAQPMQSDGIFNIRE